MQDKLSSFLKQYGSIRKRTLRLVKVVPPQHLDFAYKAGKFTIADQIRHIGAIERYLFAETIAGRKNTYQGCGKELADGYDSILAFLEQTHTESLEIFNSLDDADLEDVCYTPTGVASQKVNGCNY